MNYYEKIHQFKLDSIKEMIKYAESINIDHESEEFKNALLYWADELSDEYRNKWFLEHN